MRRAIRAANVVEVGDRERLGREPGADVVSVQRKYSGRIKKGNVISVTPVTGARRPVGTSVTLFVSRGHKPRR